MQTETLLPPLTRWTTPKESKDVCLLASFLLFLSLASTIFCVENSPAGMTKRLLTKLLSKRVKLSTPLPAKCFRASCMLSSLRGSLVGIQISDTATKIGAVSFLVAALERIRWSTTPFARMLPNSPPEFNLSARVHVCVHVCMCECVCGCACVCVCVCVCSYAFEFRVLLQFGWCAPILCV